MSAVLLARRDRSANAEEMCLIATEGGIIIVFLASDDTMLVSSNVPKPRRGLSADSLHETLRRRFQDVHDSRRQASCRFSMPDTLMSAFAMFATKQPSMLTYEDSHRELHIEKTFGI
ncbi:hypothetical protein [Roseiconus lacunae]|uniref:hypothetical protein n=1 Tax=Roseiconus lacunae TaxID=2605694 RepID=UPI001E34151D|nr:hypothetical protein [Roseiconus lacunae]MCD0458824.1 hypothetical protein [Roseiconus lacunae]